MKSSKLHASAATALAMLFALTSCGGGSGTSGATPAPVAVASPTPSPAPAPTPTPTATATAAPLVPIVGTDGNDILNGTDSNDAIEGRGGDDMISGLGGNDNLQGDRGSDTVRGGAGADRISGSQFASDGVDTLLGEDGPDTFQFTAHTTSRIVGFVPGISANLGDFQTRFDKLELHLTGTMLTDSSVNWLNDQPFTGQNRIEVRLVEGVLQLDSDGDRIPELMLRITGAIGLSDLGFSEDSFGF